MLAGAGIVVWGAQLVYEPAGFIVGGIALATYGWLFGSKE